MGMSVKRLLSAAMSAVGLISAVSFETAGTAASAASVTYSTDTIAVGTSHSLVIKNDSSLWAAGDNSFGQLGVNNIAESDGVRVMTNIAFAEANDDVSFAIDSRGTLYGWGDNSEGQISPSNSVDVITVPLKLMDNVAAVAAGDTHTIALKTDGSVYGWGSNASGELGFSANYYENEPVKIMDGVADIAAGDAFSLFVTKKGELYVCGSNGNGQLGLGDYSSRSTPVKAISDGVETAEAGSDHSVILKKDGTVLTAGANSSGQLGNGSYRVSNSFVSAGVTNAAAVFAGDSSSGALGANGTLYTWGSNYFAQLHNGKTEDLPTPAATVSNAAAYAVSDTHSLVLRTDGTVTAAGDGACGQLFTINLSSVSKPVKVAAKIVSYSAGTDHAAAVDENGRLYTWGSNDRGQLGLGDTTARSNPTRVSARAEFTKVWCGNKVTFALASDNTVYVFGDNTEGMLGIKTKTAIVTSPQANWLIPAGKNIEIYPTEGCAYALIDGTVYGWGRDIASRLLDLGTKTEEPTILGDAPVNIKKLAVGTNHVLALDNDNTVWVWGSNSYDQLGVDVIGVQTDIPTKLEIYREPNRTGGTALEADKFTDIAACDNHSMAVDADGRVWVFGLNSSGQLGTPARRIRTPECVANKAAAVAAGKVTCAVLFSDGTLSLAGANANGELGNGTVKNSSEFVTQTGTGAEYASLGNGFGGFIRTGGTLYCWGVNNYGQVGNSSGGAQTTPVVVIKDALRASIKQPESVTLDKTAATVKPGATVQLKASVTPSDAPVTFTWSSSNVNVATVSADGLVKGIAKGTADITVKTQNGKTAVCRVTVEVPVTSISVTPSKTKTITVGTSFTFKTKVYPSNADDKTLLFESSDTDVATVDANGKVTAVSTGRAVITVKSNSNPAKIKKVTVKVRPAKVTITYRKSTTNGVVLKWDDSEGADGYVVYRKVYKSSTSSKIIADTEDETAFTDETAVAGKKYIYSVKAYTVIDGKKVYSLNSKQYVITAK